MSSETQKMYWVCSDVLSLILQIRNSQNLPPADVLQRRVLGLFETMMQKGGSSQIPERDMLDVKYALAAFADEVIYHSNWPDRTKWLNNPLQLQFFQENTAGDGFFTKLDQLYSERRDHVTQVFFLCLSLGFQGKFRLAAQDGLDAVVQGVGNHVQTSVGGNDVLAPNAERKDGGTGAVRRELPFLAIALGFFVLALLVVVVLRLIVGSNAADVADGIRKLIPG